MNLTAENVRSLIMKCLPQDGELTPEQIQTAEKTGELDGYVKGEGVRNKFLFNKARLEAEKENVLSMLRELPDQFMKSKGGGWSFLNACMTKDDHQWGEHMDIDSLLCLAIPLGLVSIQMPREMWMVLPGGLPYFVVEAA